MLANFVHIWKSKGLPVYLVDFYPYQGTSVNEETLLDSLDYLKNPSSLEIVNPSRMDQIVELEDKGKRVVDGLIFSTDQSVKVLDRLVFQGVLFEVFECEYSDLMIFSNCKCRVVSREVEVKK